MCLETLLGEDVSVACAERQPLPKKTSSDMILFHRNIKVHQAEYLGLLMVSVSSSYSFNLSHTCTITMKAHVQRACYQAFILVFECAKP